MGSADRQELLDDSASSNRLQASRLVWMHVAATIGLLLLVAFIGCGDNGDGGEPSGTNGDNGASDDGDAAEFCGVGRIVCDGQCIYPASNRSHCGQCGNACAEQESCQMFECVQTAMAEDVSVASSHACAVRPNGRVVCWGANHFGQSSPPAGTFTQVGAGFAHTCGLDSDGGIVCWGSEGADSVNIPASVLDAPSGSFT